MMRQFMVLTWCEYRLLHWYNPDFRRWELVRPALDSDELDAALAALLLP